MRLRSLGTRHTHLKLVLSEQSSTRQRYKDLLSTQSSSSQCLHRWSQAEESPALQDVLHQVHDLNLMWVEAQREFVVAMKDYKRVYENVLAVEKKLDIARKNLAVCEEKEKKLQKELVKGPKDVAATQDKLKQATDSLQLADAEVNGQSRETEAVKLMSVRAGLLDVSHAWESLGSKCSLLAQSQKELAQLIPDIGSSRVQDMPAYDGSRESTRVMMATRSKLDQFEPPSASSSSSLPSSSFHRQSGSQSDAETRLTHRNFEMLSTIEPEDMEYNSFEEGDDSYESDG